MSSSTTSTVYTEAFEGARPTSTYNAVASRLRIQKAFTNDLASYYSERAKVQEAYVASLHKLSTRLHASGSNGIMTSLESLSLDKKEEDKQLGEWKSVKIQLEQEVEEQARLAELWRKQVVDTVEVPLRNSLNKPDWLRYQQVEAQLGGTVRDYEGTVEKIQKAQVKAGTKTSKSTTSKLLTSQSHLSTLGSTLSSNLPAFLSSSASLDITHATFLKEAIIRYGTINSDIGREQMEMGERLLVSALGVDEQVEMQSWALREGIKAGAGSGGVRTNGQRSSSISSESPSMGEFGGRNGGNSQRAAPIQEEEETLRAPAVRERERTASIPRPTPPPVTSLALPTTTSVSAPSPAKSGSGGGFKFSSLMKRDRATSAASTSRYGSLDVPNPSGSNANNEIDRQSFDSRASSQRDQPEEPTAMPSFARANSNTSETKKADRPQSMMFGAKKRDSMMPFSSGSIFRRQSKMSPSKEKSQQDGGLSASTNENSRGRSYSDVQSLEDRDSSRDTGATSRNVGLGASTSTVLSAGSIDAEGFSVPPAGYDKQPWATGETNLMDDDDEADDLAAAIPLPKLTSVAIAPATITESSDDRRAALERVKTTLLSAKPLAGPPVSPLGAASSGNGIARRATTRGRRDRMSTYGAPPSPILGDDIPLGMIVEQQQKARDEAIPMSRNSSIDTGSPLASPNINSSVGLPYSEERTERANSMMSTISSNSSRMMGNFTSNDPFESSTTPGMRASIIETVNVISKLGVISRVMVTGELSLSHRLAPGEIGGQTRIKLSNFDKFDKAAPDSTYLAAIAGSPGEYLIKETLGEKTTPVIKYQLRVDEGSEMDFVPLSVKASWKVEVGKARIMVVYVANEGIKLTKVGGVEDSPFDEITTKLDDLAFHLPFSLPVTTFQAKPSAQYSPDRARLSFNIDQSVIIGTGAVEGENKLLASVVTEGNGLVLAQPVAIKWSIKGRILSGVTLEVVEGKLEEVNAMIVSGKYLALYSSTQDTRDPRDAVVSVTDEYEGVLCNKYVCHLLTTLYEQQRLEYQKELPPMKAAVAHKAGGPEKLFVNYFPTSLTIGLNLPKYFVGHFPDLEFPRILGIEAVGIVHFPPQDITGFKNGDKVATAVQIIDEDAHSLDWATLGALPELLQTAHGSTTIIGLAVAAIAREFSPDSFIASTTRKSDSATKELLKKSGADHVFFDDESIEGEVQNTKPGGFDEVLELIGTTTLKDNVESVPTGITLTSYNRGSDDFMATPLNKYTKLIKESKLVIQIGQTLKLDKNVEAHKLLEENTVDGKIVILT